MKILLSVIIIFLTINVIHSQVDPHLDVEGNAKIRGNIDIMIAPGDSSVFIGVNAGMNDNGGNKKNTFVGANAGFSNTSGDHNSFFGRSAGFSNTSGDHNSFFGREAGLSNTSGTHNSFFGVAAGGNNISGLFNSFFGVTAGLENTSGFSNSFFGVEAGLKNTSGVANSFLGAFAGRDKNNTRSTILGYNAQTMDSLDRAIAIGFQAKVGCHNCAVIGGIGVEAVKVGIGTTTPTSDLYIKQSDVSTSAPSTGGITLEDDDTTNKWQINAGAGSLNFALNGVYKALILDNGNYFDLDASFRGDTDQTKSRASNLKSMDDVLNKVNKLQPSTKQSDKSNRTEWGFVAEEVAKVFPEIAPIVNGHRGIIPHYFGILSIKAIQEQQVIIEEQALQLESQQLEITSQSNVISTIKDELNVQKKQFAEMQKLLNQLIAKSEK